MIRVDTLPARIAADQSVTRASEDAISWQLRSDIACGFLMPGEPVDLELLSRRFSANRDQVLNSIVQLSHEGLICIHPQQGIFVSRLSISELMAMLELLAELEGACAKLATQRLTPADAASLRNSMRCGSSADDVLSYSRANAMFHEVLYRACRNPALTAEIARVRARTQVYRRSPFEAPARVRNSFAEHTAVMHTVLAGNPAVVRDRMVDHILTGAQELANHLSRTSGVLLGCDLDYPGRSDWFAGRMLRSPTAESTAARGIAEIVGDLIAASERYRVTPDEVAAELRLSRRTLTRKLDAEGVSFQEIKDSIRRDRAIELVQNGDKPIAEIAHELGFADASSFHRAFRAWTGTTPRARSQPRP